MSNLTISTNNCGASMFQDVLSSDESNSGWCSSSSPSNFEVRFGCELKSLSPTSQLSFFDLESSSGGEEDFEDDELALNSLFPRANSLTITEDSLSGSKFQVWEKCLASVLTSINNPSSPSSGNSATHSPALSSPLCSELTRI